MSEEPKHYNNGSELIERFVCTECGFESTYQMLCPECGAEMQFHDLVVAEEFEESNADKADRAYADQIVEQYDPNVVMAQTGIGLIEKAFDTPARRWLLSITDKLKVS
jgi:hypothetical protein